MEKRIQAQMILRQAAAKWYCLDRKVDEIRENLRSSDTANVQELESVLLEKDEFETKLPTILAGICKDLVFPTDITVGPAAAETVSLIISVCSFQRPEDLACIAESLRSTENSREKIEGKLVSEFSIPGKIILARLKDKTNTSQNIPQIYGFVCRDIVTTDEKDPDTLLRFRLPYDIFDVGHVDSRRISMGLPPLFERLADVQKADTTANVMVPARYLLNYYEPLFQEPVGVNALHFESEEGPWSLVASELNEKSIIFSDLETELSEQTDSVRRRRLREAMSDINSDCFEYILGLCSNSQFGFPTDDRVGVKAALFAWQTIKRASLNKQEEVSLLIQAATDAHAVEGKTGFPHIAELSWLLDKEQILKSGVQIFGTGWDKYCSSGGLKAYLPAPLDRPETIDAIREKAHLNPWYEHAIEFEKVHGIPTYLPLSYVIELVEGRDLREKA